MPQLFAFIRGIRSISQNKLALLQINKVYTYVSHLQDVRYFPKVNIDKMKMIDIKNHLVAHIESKLWFNFS